VVGCGFGGVMAAFRICVIGASSWKGWGMAQNENAVMYAVEQVCALYGVQVTREQSRQFNVQGAAGRWRPMFFGTWVDHFGRKRNKGKADFLARPRILSDLGHALVGDGPISTNAFRLSVPLWIECKSLKGKQTPDQAAFQQWVERNGDGYLLLREDVRPLIIWFEAHGVTKQCDDAALASVVTPLDATELYLLPCKHCGFARPQHKGKILSCPLELAACNPKLIGKVWSPDLRKGVKARGATNSEETDTAWGASEG
jgi:hypothetical protein